MFHLHGFDGDERLALADEVTDRHCDEDDPARHRRKDRSICSGFTARCGCRFGERVGQSIVEYDDLFAGGQTGGFGVADGPSMWDTLDRVRVRIPVRRPSVS